MSAHLDYFHSLLTEPHIRFSGLLTHSSNSSIEAANSFKCKSDYISSSKPHSKPCNFLGNPVDWGAWQSTVHGVTKSQTWFSDWTATKKTCNSSPLLTRITCPTNLSVARSTIQISNWTALTLLPIPGILGFIQFLSALVLFHYWTWTQTLPLSGMLFPLSPLSTGILVLGSSFSSSGC